MTKTLQVGDATYSVNPDNITIMTFLQAIDLNIFAQSEYDADTFGEQFLAKMVGGLTPDFVGIINDFFPEFASRYLVQGRPLPGEKIASGKWRLRTGGEEIISLLIAELIDGAKGAFSSIEETGAEVVPDSEPIAETDRPAPKGFAPVQAVTASNKKPLLSKVTSPIKPPVEPKPNITDIQALLQGQLPEGTTLDPDLLSRLLVNQANADSLEEITG